MHYNGTVAWGGILFSVLAGSYYYLNIRLIIETKLYPTINNKGGDLFQTNTNQ